MPTSIGHPRRSAEHPRRSPQRPVAGSPTASGASRSPTPRTTRSAIAIPLAVNRTTRYLNRWATATRNSTVASRTVWRTYRSAVSRASVPSSNAFDASAFSSCPFSVPGFTYSGMKLGPGGASGLFAGSVFDPRIERDLELGAEPPHVEGGELLVARALGLDPRVERGDVQELLLSSERQRLIGLDPQPRRRPVEVGLPSVPPRGLVAAPRGRDRHDREKDHLEDLGELDQWRFSEDSPSEPSESSCAISTFISLGHGVGSLGVAVGDGPRARAT